ncbi:DUF3560 domain-containing protein [Streptomyces sp. TRM68367]|uniref:DUF3560 domain-containing protein n=1 Tax=Streptomyces sp. TRM68367 TaxID=2758415 RepID=UPI00165AA02D|nr:DUF3560 domain-containing protein [Streptomyces sp. TRM68367]MBC9730717.1 DUF3560 domain-containing protein [Streptomyces sp. TRM68367]
MTAEATYQAAFTPADREVTVIRDIPAGISGPFGEYPADDLDAAERALWEAGYAVASEWGKETVNGDRWCKLTRIPPGTPYPAPAAEEAPADTAEQEQPKATGPTRVDTPEQREADRLTKIADDLEAAAERMSQQASGMYGRFQGGQPLLVGHHSYRSAVRDRDRADNATRRAIEAGKTAERARHKARQAQALADLAAIEALRTREWQRSDFQAGDIVRVRDFRLDTAVTGRYRVKRANVKTLTLDGGGGGMDDPRREYARVLSRTRDGVTVTDPTRPLSGLRRKSFGG